MPVALRPNEIISILNMPAAARGYLGILGIHFVGGLASIGGFVWWLRREPSRPIAFLLLLAGIAVLISTVLRLFTFVQGRFVFAQEKHTRLCGGEFNFPGPGLPFDLWIFCATPFHALHGEIVIKNSAGTVHKLIVPRRTPGAAWLWYSANEASPIVWRSPVGDDTNADYTISLSLCSAYRGCALEEIHPATETDRVAIVVKRQRASRIRSS